VLKRNLPTLTHIHVSNPHIDNLATAGKALEQVLNSVKT